MKRILLLVIWLASTAAHAQWYTICTNATNGIFRDVQFTDNTTGYACGEGNTQGVIYKSVNAGVSWSLVYQTSAGAEWIYDLYFTAMDTGYAVGENGKIYKTSDGGSNWTTQQFMTVNEFNAVFFPSADTGYAVGNSSSSPVIYKTVDAGVNWIPQVITATGTLNDVYFTSNSNGYCAGSDVILHTSNGGVTWTDVSYSGDNYDHYAVVCTNDSTCYVSGISVLMTTNSGVTWTNTYNQIPLGDSVYVFQSLFFTDAMNGYAGGYKADTAFSNGYGVIFGTADGGMTWTMEASVTDNPVLFGNDVQALYFTSQDTGYAVGNTGFVLSTDNGGATGSIVQSTNTGIFKLYPNPVTDVISITDSDPSTSGSVCNIYSSIGTLVKTEQLNASSLRISMSELSNGLYVIELVNSEFTEYHRILVQHE